MNTIISQAMATGMPVVATRHSGLPEQVLDGKNGLVASEADPEDLARKLEAIMEKSALWPQMGQVGRAHALRAYDASVLIERQIILYREACRRG